jgi:hypothetical protein
MVAVSVEVQSSPVDDGDTSSSSLISIRVDALLRDHSVAGASSEGQQQQQELRDTSHCSNRTLNNSRGTVNTHHSILNITEDEDEEDEDDQVETSFLFPELHEQPPQVEVLLDEDFAPRKCCDLQQSSVLDKMTEQFMDSLCGTHERLEVDFFDMLGCPSSQPSSGEEKRWALNQTLLCNYHRKSVACSPARPRRKDLKQRAILLDKLRQERCGGSPTSVIHRVQSLDDRPRKASQEDGYDSDPELVLPRPRPHPKIQTIDESKDVAYTVQETLNIAWNVTWHPAQGKPECCRVWIERGTLVNMNTQMLEPSLMWMPNYKGICVPHTVRLLNICRIVNVDPDTLDRKRYPLARPSYSFWVRTANNQEEFLFQCANPQERNVLIKRWKHCVARFATLAVMEDMEAICKEFFYLDTAGQTYE